MPDGALLEGATRTDYVLTVALPGEPPQPIGTEARFVAERGDRKVVARWNSTWLELGGERTELVRHSRVEGPRAGPADRYVQWRSDEERTWTGSAWVPDVWPPPGPGRWPVLDPFSLEVLTVEVSADETGWSWVGSGGEVRAVYDDHGLQRATQGVFRLERGAAPDTFAAFDPVALYAIPTAAYPRADRSLVGRFIVDGALTRTDAPIWAQVPSVPLPPHGPSEAASLVQDAADARRAVQELVAHVHRSLDGVPRPGTLDAMDALRSGRGDCDEAAAAFVELARSVGLEADPVGGLVYREGAVGPALYPHAWATVRLGGVTVAVDPALGQSPADASHVPLGYSAAEAVARLSRGVQIAVIELR